MAAAATERDRFGLGWRRELAAEIDARLDRIDVLEVIADDWFDAPRVRADALRLLSRRVPIELHAVSLGLATSERADETKIAQLARLADKLDGVAWSEHLAFVRGGGVEIGHLAAPPRTVASIEGLARNVERAAAVIGSRPRLENVATLIDPPGSRMDEAEWVAGCLDASACDLLLDLHNLHANATNFGFDAHAFLDRIPIERVASIHIAGGRLIRRGRIERVLDDHCHAVPHPIFELLEQVGARATRPLTVILERDGRFPRVDDLLAELDRARAALRRGRARARRDDAPEHFEPALHVAGDASPNAEAFLARLYTDERERARLGG